MRPGLTVGRECKIRDALKHISENAQKFLMVLEDKTLLGVITDGDIRRWILKNGDLGDTVEKIMNVTPITLFEKERHLARHLMLEHGVFALPVITSNRELVDLILWTDLGEDKKKANVLDVPVVIMAGGKGTRLLPYTKIIPKPLIPIGEKPIIERIMINFQEQGIKEFFITINYKRSMMKTYFAEELPMYPVTFIEEEQFMGTAGSLSLMKESLSTDFFVSNCDVLVYGEYEEILKYHRETKAVMTIVTSVKNSVIPYGVIKLNENGDVERIEEKPQSSYLINTGLYILNPEALTYIDTSGPFDMTDLIKRCIDERKRVSIYPIDENSWLDMGQLKEMEEMIKRLNV